MGGVLSRIRGVAGGVVPPTKEVEDSEEELAFDSTVLGEDALEDKVNDPNVTVISEVGDDTQNDSLLVNVGSDTDQEATVTSNGVHDTSSEVVADDDTEEDTEEGDNLIPIVEIPMLPDFAEEVKRSAASNGHRNGHENGGGSLATIVELDNYYLLYIILIGDVTVDEQLSETGHHHRLDALRAELGTEESNDSLRHETSSISGSEASDRPVRSSSR